MRRTGLLAVPPPAAPCGKGNLFIYRLPSLHFRRFPNKKSRGQPDRMKKKQLTADKSCWIMPVDGMSGANETPDIYSGPHQPQKATARPSGIRPRPETPREPSGARTPDNLIKSQVSFFHFRPRRGSGTSGKRTCSKPSKNKGGRFYE